MATFKLKTRPHHSSSFAFQQLLGYTSRVPQERGTGAVEGLSMQQLDNFFSQLHKAKRTCNGPAKLHSTTRNWRQKTIFNATSGGTYRPHTR